MFDDDWAAARYIYPRLAESSPTGDHMARPPITLLVMAVGDNIIFDPSKEELAVADSALAVSVSEGGGRSTASGPPPEKMDLEDKTEGRNLRLLSVRTIDPPSRLTPPGVPNSVNAAAWAAQGVTAKNPEARTSETEDVVGVWKAPRGGIKFALLSAMVQAVLEKGGVADEVLEGLEGVELE
jgi:exosome complex component RRP42